jgi:tRNA threonylcarbamoyladenosine biosynthesis protein TsaB
MPEPQHLILAFDTAGPALSVALCRAGEGRAQVICGLHKPLQRGHAEQLLPTVNAIMRTAGVHFAALDAIATTVGPGSFTGLRTGLAAAQGLALATGVPLIGIDRFSALGSASGLLSKYPLVVAFDSRARSLYVQAFAANGDVAEGWPAEGRNLSATEACLAISAAANTPTARPISMAGDGAPALIEAGLQGADVNIHAVTAPVVASAAARCLKAGTTGWQPLPLYLAPPRATPPKDGGRIRAREA